MPEIVNGSRDLKSLTVTSVPVELSSGFSFNEMDQSPRILAYTGDEADEAYTGTQSLKIILTNVDNDVTEYTVELVVETYIYPTLASDLSDLRIVAGFAETYIIPEVIVGTSPLK